MKEVTSYCLQLWFINQPSCSLLKQKKAFTTSHCQTPASDAVKSHGTEPGSSYKDM